MNPNPHIPELANVAEIPTAEAEVIFANRLDALLAAGAAPGDRNAAYAVARNLWPALAARLGSTNAAAPSREDMIREKMSAGLTREQAISAIANQAKFTAAQSAS